MRAIFVLVLAVGTAFAAPDGFGSRELTARRERFARDEARPQALVPLLGILDLWELVQDRQPIVTFLEQVAGSGKARPEVRARAQYLLSLAYDRLGRADDATRLRAGLGLVTAFRIAGPFDNEGKAGHAAVYGPETGSKAVDEKVTWDGKERRVGWRVLPPVAAQGMVPLDAVLRPETNVTAYLVTAVYAPKKVAAAVRVGSTGAIKVWVNGRKALDRDVYRALRIDQDAGGAVLEAGWNRVLVKLSAAESGGAQLFLRLTRADGSPIDGLKISTEIKDLSMSAPKSGAAPAVAMVGRELEKAALKGAPQALTDWGLYLHYVAPEDPEKHAAAQALEAAVRLNPTPEGWLRLAGAQTDANDQRHSLEEGQALCDGKPACAPIETQLGELDYRARRERRAEEHWRKALKEDPAHYPAAIRLAELEADRGLPARAAMELETLAKSLTPPPIKLLRSQANLAVRRSRRSEAEKLHQQIAELGRDDTDVLHELFSVARTHGRTDEALKVLDRMQALRPDVLSFALERAELLDGIGRTADAHTALEAALAIAPDDARLLERDGRMLHRLGREPQALEKLRRSLELRPQNPELRAYLAELEARLGPKSGAPAGEDLARVYAEDVKALIAHAPKPKADGSPSRILLDSAVTRVHANGLSETYQQRVVQILDERGAREEGDFDLRYTPDTQSVEVRVARVHKPNGEVLEAVSVDETDVSEPWYGLYYDVRGQIIRFSALQPGDVIDVEYVISDVGRRNLFADYFGELHFFQEETPRVESRYVLIAPKTKKLYFNQPKLPGLVRESETKGDDTIYRFRAVDIPKVDAEPGMPGYSEVAAYVHVSTYKAWSDVATWYTGLVRGQLEPNGAIHDAVRAAIKGLKDERAKIRAVYDLVVKRTRYVGLEFGIHGYQPYRVSQVFARKFGDCKDKASLLVVMLKEAGIDASLVLARTRHGGNLDAEPASLAPFDHAIAWVPKYDLYLDGTAEFSGADELPAQDQDIPVLQVSTGKLVRTPVLPAARNHVVTDWRVALDGAGNARVDEQMTISGEAAHEWRSHYQAPGERADKYDQAWNGKHPGAHVEKLEMALDDLEKPVTVQSAVDVPRWARADEGGLLVMPALGRDADMLRSYARLSARKHDLVLGYPWLQDERVTVQLQPGWKVRRLPEARTITAPFGRFVMSASEAGGRVTVTATLQVDRHRISTVDYAAFRRFCADVDAAVAQELVVEAAKPQAAR